MTGVLRQLLGATLSFLLAAPAYSHGPNISYEAPFASRTNLRDRHISVRALTDTTSTVTDTYDYDAFGNLIHSTGTTYNNYLFAGEQFDPDLNLYYNRARYLNVSTGRFWSMDTFEGRDKSPLSLHKYLYASGDSVNRADPTGQFDLLDATLVVGLSFTLSSISGCTAGPRIVTVGVTFSNTWDIGSSGALSQPEIAIVKDTAFQVLRDAYKGFAVFFSEGSRPSHTIIVRSGLYGKAGETTPFSSVSNVDYDDLYFSLLKILGIRSPGEKGITRDQLVEGLGRGIGATGAHELGHQGNFSYATDTTVCDSCYDAHSADSYVHFFGMKHWSDAAMALMKRQLPGSDQ